MRKFRNPRYAPEYLERKLSPSDVGVTLPTVDVTTLPPTTDPTTATPPISITVALPGTPVDTTDPPIIIAPMPNNPAGPA